MSEMEAGHRRKGGFLPERSERFSTGWVKNNLAVLSKTITPVCKVLCLASQPNIQH